MSEPIWMSINIGGDLPSGHAEEFLGYAKDEINESTDVPTTLKELRAMSRRCERDKTHITFSGCANYGLCDDLMAFLERHNLSYINNCEGKDEYGPSIAYWVPTMKESKSVCSLEQEPIVLVSDIKPYCDLMLAIIKEGQAALPRFLNDENLKGVIEKGLKSYKRFPVTLQKELAKLMPVIPDIPTFRIV